MEHKNTELQEAQSAAVEPTAAPEPRPWITPTFERVPLSEALDNLGSGGDFNGRAS
jgi:hypothetical protein